ncbi:MAG: MFS transporter [Rhodospirillaceae bacterium]
MDRQDAEQAAEGTGWADMFRGARGIYTVLLNLGIGIHAIDIFVIATIMPVVVSDIGGVEFYAWTTMLYMVGTIVGAASGRYVRSILGRRRGYVAGGLIFLAGAAGCAVAPSMGALLLFRVVEGFGGGLLMSQSMTLVNDFYTGQLRTRVLATITTTWSVASVAGPLIGGVWGSIGWWRGAFLTTCLLTILFIIAAWRVIPESDRGRRLPLPLLRLLMLGFSVVLVGTTGQFSELWLRIVLIGAGIVCMWATLRLDGGREGALFPNRVLSLYDPIGTAYWVFFLLAAAYTPLTIFVPLALQSLYGLDPLWIGYIATVFSLAWALGSLATAGWKGFTARAACAGGLAIAAAAAFAMSQTVNSGSILLLTALMFVSGLGIGMTNVHIISWALAAAGREQAQITASAMPAMRSVGIAYGAAFAGLIANAAGLDEGVSPEIVRNALPWVFGVAAVFPLAGSLCIVHMYRLKPGVKV